MKTLVILSGAAIARSEMRAESNHPYPLNATASVQ
jgi:hypothetical protein